MYPLVGRLDRNRRTLGLVRISIHAPLAGCDSVARAAASVADISIHAPLAGCDGKRGRFGRHGGHFNPRTPCGVRPRGIGGLKAKRCISIHAPLAGCDTIRRYHSFYVRRISIHAPLAGCDISLPQYGHSTLISIHAPLAGCDATTAGAGTTRWRFQSTHPLRGATTA